MARLPGAQDLGGLPTPAVVGVDTSAIDRGGAALAAGVQQLGKGIGQAGEGTAELAVDQQRWDYAKAHSQLLSNLVDQNEKTKTDTNYGPDDTGKSLPNRHAEAVWKLQSDASNLIAPGPMRERFMSETNPLVARSVVAGTEHTRTLENSANVAWMRQAGDDAINKGIAAPDDETRRQLIDAHNQLIDGLVAKGAMTAVQAVEEKRTWAHQFATADLMHRADTDPQGVINELRVKPGSGDDVTNRIDRIEGEGKNPSSSATGKGQFIDATWLDVLKRNRPDLAAGRSDQELLALRADKGLARSMIDAYRRENEASLTKAGVQPTPGAAYLAHFLGPGGAIAVLKADPNQPVAEVLAKAVGPKQAQAMIAANPTILQGKLAGSVTQWADAKMGGATPGVSSIYNILRPDVRETILYRAQQQQQKNSVEDLSAFKQKVEDTQAEAARTGSVTAPLQLADFIGKLGADAGPGAYAQYKANLQLSADVARVAALSPGEQQELLKSYEPKPGAEGYADQSKRSDVLAKAVEHVDKEKTADAAAFAINRLPVVSEAYTKFMGTLADPTAAPEARREAARDLAVKMEMEQARVGVAPEARRIVPKGYVDEFNKMLARPDATGGTRNVAAAIEQEAQMWGAHWPSVYRQLAKDAEPVVKVLGAGVKPAAAQILVETAKMPLAEILKDQDTEKSAAVKKAVLDAFKPLATSLAGNEGGVKTFNDFRGQGEKLAAFYVMKGMNAADAGTKAFDDLVGFKYDFSSGSYRVPKDIVFTPGQIAAGVTAAKEKLASFDLALPRDTIGGLSSEYLAGAAARTFARDGVWVTAPDESGLALIYNDQAVMRRDGKPLTLTWAELAAMGEQRARDEDERIKHSSYWPYVAPTAVGP